MVLKSTSVHKEMVIRSPIAIGTALKNVVQCVIEFF